MKNSRYIRKFNESDSSDNYLISRIVSIMKNDELDFDRKLNNILKMIGIDKPELPPLIIPCEITLKDGKKKIAYLEENKPPYRFPDEDEDKRGIWIEYGKTKSPRNNWKIEEVESWKFI
jgi:hypothetical protein